VKADLNIIMDLVHDTHQSGPKFGSICKIINAANLINLLTEIKSFWSSC
jgi:hypothetical protein